MSLSDDGVAVTLRRKDKLFAKLQRLRPAAAQELAGSIAKGADEMVRLAKQLAPHDTGALARSIHVELDNEPSAPRVRVVAGDKDAYYARWVEFGTRPATKGDKVVDKNGRVRKSGRTHPGTPARPFFYPAYRLLKRKMISRMGRALGKAAKQVSGNGGAGE